jgi:inhibitor-of-growth protein 1
LIDLILNLDFVKCVCFFAGGCCCKFKKMTRSGTPRVLQSKSPTRSPHARAKATPLRTSGLPGLALDATPTPTTHSQVITPNHNNIDRPQTAFEQNLEDTLISYLSTIEGVPFDLKRVLDEQRKVDEQFSGLQTLLRRAIDEPEEYSGDIDPSLLPNMLMELADKKAALGIQPYDLVDDHIKRLDGELDRIESEIRETYRSVPIGPITAEYARERRVSEGMWNMENYSGLGQVEAVPQTPVLTSPRRKGRGASSSNRKIVRKSAAHEAAVASAQEEQLRKMSIGSAEVDFPFDPHEPTYCLCSKPSFGSMIKCDNDECMIEWFHFECVGLNSQPKGKWFCPTCAPFANPPQPSSSSSKPGRKKKQFY